MSEDDNDPAFYWEMMCKNLARENHRMMERLGKLEDLNRWRKWPEEKPTDEANFLVVDKHGLFSVKYWCEDAAWLWHELLENGSCWRPIGPLPGEGGE